MVSIAAKIICLLILVYAIFDIVNCKNENNRSLIWGFYLMSAEVFFRMTEAVVSWEQIKYSVFLILLIGVLVDRKPLGVPAGYLFYLMLLFVGISFTDVPEDASMRKAIVFNLLGPVLLGWCAIVFYKREIKLNTVYLALFYGILPVLSMVIFLYFRTPTLSEIRFRGTANFQTSGGFGPNQVATALGFGIFAISALMIAKKKITGFLILDVFLLLYVIFRGLLTFSRGGMLTGVLVLIAFAIFFALSSKNYIKIFIKYIIMSLLFVTAIWVYTSEVTGGMLNNRYTGKNESGVQKKDISSGRGDIISFQFDNFMQNPIFGIGVGNGKYSRKGSGKHITGASHNEMGRIIEEHGLIGLLSLTFLLVVPLLHLRAQSNISMAFTISFYLLWFLTINHSGMRIAFPAFVYSLSLLNITTDEEEN